MPQSPIAGVTSGQNAHPSPTETSASAAEAASSMTTASSPDSTHAPPSGADSIVLPKRPHVQSRPHREQSPGPLANSTTSISGPNAKSATSAVIASSILPYRRSNSNLSSVFASTASLNSSAPSSGTATPTANRAGFSRTNSTFSSIGGGGNASVVGSPLVADANGRTASPARAPVAGAPNARVDLEPGNVILRAFAPHIAVVTSEDTDELLVGRKGIPGGLLQILRPFGERIMGKVTIRDSIGAGRSWDDYGVRFTGLKDGLKPPRASLERQSPQQQGAGRASSESQSSGRNGVKSRPSFHCDRTGGDVAEVEEAVLKHLEYGEAQGEDDIEEHLRQKETLRKLDYPQPTSAFHLLYLRRLLSGLPMSPHETFSHPVACVIAISSRNPTPIEDLRRLYTCTYSGEHRLPQWVDSDYLRYYVLVHDEDEDDIQRSSVLFDNMKRHFGLHCHLLRIRSSQAAASDDDSVRLPMCEWISASEELEEIRRRENLLGDFDEDPTPCIFDSDVTAIRTFIRELVAQSVVPFMERTVATWNDQVASRKKGLSGRFMSLSKKFPFGGSRSSSGSGGGGGSGNYDALQGFYRLDAPEATLRKLGDFAFMLRDFKLAHSTYELARSDFQSDKAWRHYSGANEMAALSALLLTGGASSSSAPGASGASTPSSTISNPKYRPEAINQLLDTAVYSYVTRCQAPFSALRTLAVATELLRLRGSADDAARCATRILESRLVGPVGTALFTERTGACFAGRPGVGEAKYGSRSRRAAFGALMAAEEWMLIGKTARAQECLADARALYYSESVKQDSNTVASATLAAVERPDMDVSRGPVFPKDVPNTSPFDRMPAPYQHYIDFLHTRIQDARAAAAQRLNHGNNLLDADESDGNTAGMSPGNADPASFDGANDVIEEVDEVEGEDLQVQDRRKSRHRKSTIGGGLDPAMLPGGLGLDLDEGNRDGGMDAGFQ